MTRHVTDGHSGVHLQLFHIVIAQAKMVADFVDEYVGDDLAQRLLILGPIVENGAAEES